MSDGTICGAPPPEFTEERMNRAYREMKAIWGDTPNEVYLNPMDFWQFVEDYMPFGGPPPQGETPVVCLATGLQLIPDEDVPVGAMETDDGEEGFAI